MSDESSIFDTPEMKDAEEQLRVALENLLGAMSEGPVVHSIDSVGWSEDGKTFSVWCTLPDGTSALWAFEAGQPVHYSVHDTGSEPPAPHADPT